MIGCDPGCAFVVLRRWVKVREDARRSWKGGLWEDVTHLCIRRVVAHAGAREDGVRRRACERLVASKRGVEALTHLRWEMVGDGGRRWWRWWEMMEMMEMVGDGRRWWEMVQAGRSSPRSPASTAFRTSSR